YSSADQVNEVSVGRPCPGEDCGLVRDDIRLISDAAFDERGNVLRLAFGHGVVTRNEFDARSNRIVSSSSRVGVPCIEFGPGDDCSKSAPPILFQNLSYRYDAAGNVASYGNVPRYAEEPCAGLPAGQPCPQISRRHAGLLGLLVTRADNNFAYD